MHRVKLEHLQQRDNLREKVYAFVIKAKEIETKRKLNEASKELWKIRNQYTNLCLLEGILCQKHQAEPNF